MPQPLWKCYCGLLPQHGLSGVSSIPAKRIWELRQNVTAYDAAYLVLAEALRAPLVTCDRALASSHGHRATVELMEG